MKSGDLILAVHESGAFPCEGCGGPTHVNAVRILPLPPGWIPVPEGSAEIDVDEDGNYTCENCPAPKEGEKP